MTPDEVSTQPTLSPEQMQDIIDIYPDVAVAHIPWPWLIGSALVILFIAVACAIWWRRRKPRPAPLPSPAERFLQALATLSATPSDNPQTFYEHARETINRYLEHRTAIKVDPLSGEELLAWIDTHSAQYPEFSDLAPLIDRYTRAIFAGEKIDAETMKDDLHLVAQRASNNAH